MAPPPMSEPRPKKAQRAWITTGQNDLLSVTRPRRASSGDVFAGPESAISPRTLVPEGQNFFPDTVNATSEEHMARHQEKAQLSAQIAANLNGEQAAEPTSDSDENKTEPSSDITSGILTIVYRRPSTESRVELVGHHRALGDAYKTFIVGPVGLEKRFHIRVSILVNDSVYFQQLFDVSPTLDSIVYPQYNPAAFQIVVDVVTTGTANDPVDFFDVRDSFTAYVICKNLSFEKAQNSIMDMIRAYYRKNNYTCSAYRVEYVSRFTDPGDKMRAFVLGTVALREAQRTDEEQSEIWKVLEGYDLTEDYHHVITELMVRRPFDPRYDPDCQYHKHEYTPVCAVTQANVLNGI